MVTFEDVKGLKVPELKEELKTLGLDTKGVKADLVKRLEEALSSKTVQATAPAPASDSAAPVGDAPAQPAAESQPEAANGRAKIEFKPNSASAVEAPAKPAAEAPAAKPVAAQQVAGLTEVDRRKQRAERFGVPVAETDKLKTRAERFGLASKAAEDSKDKSKAGITPMSDALKAANIEKRNERAKRFNLPLTRTPEEEALRKKARLERFGSQTAGVTSKPADSEELQKKLAVRAERFALEKKAAGGAEAAVLNPEAEAKRQARAIRFAAN